MNWFQLVLTLLLLSFNGYSSSGALHANLRSLNIADLHPTQATVGLREVKRKKNKIESFKSHKDRDEYFQRNSVPIVLGPDGQIYLIDHHHFTMAAAQAGYEQVYVHIVADFSAFNIRAFWSEMKKKAWVYLKDNGKKISEYQLPRYITWLKDDPYRSLAGKVRQKDGFNKTEIPFAEFQWADFFRSRIAEELIEKEYNEAVAVAIKLAKTVEAKKLPGYNGNALCIEVYAN
jgi:hypothetical protein